MFIKCINASPTVTLSPVTTTSTSVGQGTIYPQIEIVNPGKLQTLDVPNPVPSNIAPECPGMLVVFSHTMENDSGEMKFSIELYKDNNPVAIEISPAVSSRYFVINTVPSSTLATGTVYSLRVHKSAYIDNEPSRNLKFDNLVEPPASTLSMADPEYVEYMFKTGTNTGTDTIHPTLQSTNPANGNTGVDRSLNPLGYIEIVFYDNIVPMIDPTTVNNTSVILDNITSGGTITGSLSLVTTDYDFKTYRFTPTPSPTLSPLTLYRLTVSSSNSVKDFSGNVLYQQTVYFTTGP